MDFSIAEKNHREEILGAVKTELSGGTKTGLAPHEKDSVLYFRQLDLAIVGRKSASGSEIINAPKTN
jgi:hypothetical protein